MKKLIVFLLIIALSVPYVSAYAQTYNHNDFDNRLVSKEFFDEVFPHLNIPSDGDFTRGEFVNAVVNMMTDHIPSNYEGGYADIDSTYKYGGAIKFAEAGELISKANLFYPDAKIRFNQAVKIAVSAAGYDVQAKIKGGYPEGYIYCASNAGILDGLSLGGEDFLSYRDGLILLYNMATVDMLFETSFGDRVTYSTQDGVNMLSKYKHIIKAEGKVSGNQYTFVNDPVEACKKGFISINGEQYKTDKYQNSLGKNILYFYKDTKDKEILFARDFENNIVEFENDDSLSLENGSIVCYNSEKKETDYKLEGVYHLILNGKSGRTQNISPYLSNENAKITMIDNNQNNKYDVVLVDIIDYGVASNLINTERKLTDKYKPAYILDLSDTDISLNVYLPDGSLGEFGSINNDDVIGVTFSEDGLLCNIRIYENYVRGTIESKNGNIVYIDGKEYILSSYYRDYINSVSYEKECVYFLGEENDIVSVLTKVSDAMYGYFVDVSRKQALDSENLVKIFDEKGNMGIYELSERVKYNGVSYNKADIIPQLEALRDLAPRYKVIKFKLNGENVVQKILTAEEALGLNEIPFVSDYETRPRLYYTGETNYVKGVFSPYFRSKGSTVFMNVPSDYENDEFYAVFKETNYNGKTPSLSAYDLDLGAGAGFVLQISSGGTGGAGHITDSSSSAIVERIYTTSNKDGTVVPGIQIFNGNNHLKYTAKDSTDVLSVFETLRPGDWIRFTSDNYNVIHEIFIDFTYSTKTINDGPEDYIAEWEADDGSGKRMEFVAGKIYSSDDIFCIVARKDTDMTSAMPVSGNICISVGASPVFAEIIRDRDGSISRVSASKKPATYIESYRNTGNENSFIVSRQYFREPRLTVIYTEAN